MGNIPRDWRFDSSYALLASEGYEFVTNRCRKLKTDVFRTRIMLRKAVCMQGAEAAEVFYHPGRFTRKRALPVFALTLIQDFGSVMVLDGEAHRKRKAMFLSMMSEQALADLAERTGARFREAARGWQSKRRLVLFREAHVPLTAAICEWTGLNLRPRVIRKLAREFEAMVEGTGSVGLRNWRGHLKRRRTERRMRKIIESVRSGALRAPEGSPVHTIAHFRDTDGKLLDTRSAAVELINVLRPTVANARYIVFAAMALHRHPELRGPLSVNDELLPAFVDEVRRYYPFIPVIGGRVLQPFEWRGHRFKLDDWVLMDLYGTNHDERIWGDPENFRPDRFRESQYGPFDLISHGGGDRRVTHRCPGECITVEQLKAAVRVLVREMTYDVPAQNLSMNLGRIPAIPQSRFVMRNVRLKP